MFIISIHIFITLNFTTIIIDGDNFEYKGSIEVVDYYFYIKENDFKYIAEVKKYYFANCYYYPLKRIRGDGREKIPLQVSGLNGFCCRHDIKGTNEIQKTNY